MSRELENWTAEDDSDLMEQEAVINRAQKTFVDLGIALKRIRDHRLYRKTHKTFEDYCGERLEWTRRWVNLQIESAEIVKSLPVKMGTKVPNVEAARELSKVPEENRIEVLKSAEASGKITATSIKQASTEKTIDAEVYDKTEPPTIVPKDIVNEWNHAEAFSEKLRQLSMIKCLVEVGRAQREPMFHEIRQDTVSNLKNIYADLKRVLPYAVCTSCQGHQRKKCTFCGGRGYISEFTYKTCVPEEIKKMRKK